MWDAFETGTILIESDQGKKTTVYYKLLNTKTTMDANSSYGSNLITSFHINIFPREFCNTFYFITRYRAKLYYQNF